MTNTLIIKNELEQLTRLYAFLDRQAVAYGLEELQLMQVKLALEEAVTNVILYAYPDKKEQDILIQCHMEILQCIIDQSETRAVECMKEHIDQFKRINKQ